MKKIIAWFVFTCSVLFICSFTAQQSLRLLYRIPLASDFFSTDLLGNTYLVHNNSIVQYDSIGFKKNSFNETRSGKIFSIDASNPLKVIVFYKELAQLIILDSKLAEQTKVKLREAGIQLPMATCISSTGGFWIYDAQDFQLKLYNDQLNRQYESGNLNQILGQALNPTSMLEYESRIYINNPESGILIFDFFGNYLKTIPEKQAQSFQVIEDDIYFLRNKTLFKYNLKSYTAAAMDVGTQMLEEASGIRIGRNKIFIKNKNSVDVYSLSK